MKNVIFVLVVLTTLLNACTREPQPTPFPPDQAIPTLSNPIASFSTATRFYPFGDPNLGNPANNAYQIMMSDSSLKFLAACSGIVASITPVANGASNVLIKYKSNSVYSFLYGGVKNVQVNLNDSLTAGAVLGGISSIITFSLIRNNTTALCPASYASSGFNSSIQFAISQSNKANPQDTVSVPCLIDSLPF